MAVITTKQELEEKVRKEFWETDCEFCGGYFDLEVSMPKADILEVYADLQHDFNGDVVSFPDDITGVYTGNCQEYLESCNDKPGYTRFDYVDGNQLDFVF